MALAITRQDLSIAELRQTAARSHDANAARRMLTIALVLEGASREEAAESCGMDRQTLRDWVGSVSSRARGAVARHLRLSAYPAARMASAVAARWRWGLAKTWGNCLPALV